MKKNLLPGIVTCQFKKTFMLMALICAACFTATAQPATALSFDGTNDRVDLPNILTASYTKEAWIYAPLDNGAVNNQNIVSGTATAFWFPGNQGFQLTAGHNTFPYNNVQDPTPLVPNTWYHVAVTYDAATTTMTLYKNGVQVDVDNATPTHSESSLYIGAFLGANYYKGLIDEVRIWSVALTVGEIRDWMCQKATASHPQWANLLAYYKADDGSGTNLDDSRNTNDGTLVGGTAWATSGASLGDASAHDYVNATKSATITYTATGESLTATNTGGAPDGIHVYRVDMAPTNSAGVVGLGSNNKYFGVFQVGGTAPTYTAVYFYNDVHNTGDESSLRLYRRADNSAAVWTETTATQDDPSNTLTLTGETLTEYVLGSIGDVLPVTFTGFSLRKERNGVNLIWSTASEVNNDGFEIQRSADGRGNWVSIAFVPGNNSTEGGNYTFLDQQPLKGVNYYRINQRDFSGSSKFSDIRVISYLTRAVVSVYPVPSANVITIDINKESLLNTEVRIVDAQNREVKRFIIKNLQEEVSIQSLVKGIYILQFADGSSHKLIKH